MARQLKLFDTQRKQTNKSTFSKLSIHQKINYKANECGMHSVYLSFYNYFRKPLIQPIIDTLTSKYTWHHSVNSGAEVRIDAYRKTQVHQTELSL